MSTAGKDTSRTIQERLAAATLAASGGIPEDGVNTHDRYKYASVHQIAGIAARAMAEQGVTMLPVGKRLVEDAEVRSSSGKVGRRVVVEVIWRIQCTAPTGVVPVDGIHYIETTSYGEAMDYSDKCWGKAQQYARKQALIEVLNLRTGEDPDLESPQAGQTQRARKAAPKKEETTAEDLLAVMVKAGEAVGVDAEAVALAAVQASAAAAGRDPNGFDWPDILEQVEEARDAARHAVREAIRAARKGASKGEGPEPATGGGSGTGRSAQERPAPPEQGDADEFSA